MGLTTPPPAAGTLLGANDGLSTDLATGTIAQLGQAVGRPGNPAGLTEDREIPDNNHRLFFGKNDGVSNVIGFSTALGIFVANNTGQAFEAFWQIGANTNTFQIFTDDAVDILLSFNGTAHITWNGDATNPGRFDIDAPWIMDQGFGYGELSFASGVNPAVTLTKNMTMILVDTTGGNFQLNVNVVAGQLANQQFTIKKISADVNTVTINMVAGTIQADVAAATYVFNVPGTAVTFKTGLLNANII